MKQIRKVISCGLVPLRKKGGEVQVLLVRQHNGDWSFPKGHQEEGESCLTTALREFQEETGLQATKVWEAKKFSLAFQKEYDDWILDKEVFFFLAEVEGDERWKLQEEEIQDACWCPPAEALQKLPFPSSRKVLEEVRIFLKSREK